jgi:DNA primase
MSDNANFEIIREADSRIKLIEVLSGYDVHPQHAYNNSEWSTSMQCPLHKSGQERTPSFGYNFNKDYFNCFGCSKSGRSAAFISLIENRPIVSVAKEILLLHPKTGESDDFVPEKFEDLFPHLMDVSSFFREKLSKNKNNPKQIERIEKLMFFIDLYIFKKASVNKLKKEHINIRLSKVKELLP